MGVLDDLQKIDPFELEELVADVWEAKGFDTKVRKKTGDRGVDVEARKNEYLEIIQVKRYSGNNNIGSQMVRNYATLYQQIPDADVIVIVTSGGFTDEARSLAKDLDVVIYDGTDLLEELKEYNIELVSNISYIRNSGGEKENVTQSIPNSKQNPFDAESTYSKISSNQGYVSHCPDCTSNSIWYGQRRYNDQNYTYLKCGNCSMIWVSNGSPPAKSIDSWTSIENEDDIEKHRIREKINKQSQSRSKSLTVDGDGCFIATAVYGTPQAQEIDVLRDFRDNVLLQNLVGEIAVRLYYWGSPPIADWISKKESRKRVVRALVVEPSVCFVENFTSRSEVDRY